MSVVRPQGGKVPSRATLANHAWAAIGSVLEAVFWTTDVLREHRKVRRHPR